MLRFDPNATENPLPGIVTLLGIQPPVCPVPGFILTEKVPGRAGVPFLVQATGKIEPLMHIDLQQSPIARAKAPSMFVTKDISQCHNNGTVQTLPAQGVIVE
jgi:hypothetical protein